MDLSNTFSDSTIIDNETGVTNLSRDSSTLTAHFTDNFISNNTTDDTNAAGDGVQGVGVVSISSGSSAMTLTMDAVGPGNFITLNEVGVVNSSNDSSTLTGTFDSFTVMSNRTDDVTAGGVGLPGGRISPVAEAAGKPASRSPASSWRGSISRG